MLEKIEAYLKEIESFSTSSKEELEQFRIKFIGSKGLLKDLFDDFKAVPKEQKKEAGQKLNALKNSATEKFQNLLNNLSNQTESKTENFDYSRPGTPINLGSQHPVSIVIKEMCDIFSRIGFTVKEGPEIEDDWHNFTALNFPEEHPARDMQDTFFINSESQHALRTHTSSVQIRVMENEKPPLRIIAPGRVFRNEAISAPSHCIFHQVEGFYIDKDVSFADLKQTLQYFAKEFFGKAKIRLRPSYFPFTEPSAEMDVYWGLETETDYKITKGTGWLEVLGCGMIDPNVLENCGIDSKIYSGYAFGIGVERIAMQRFNIPDIRMIFENDIRFLNQFKSVI